MKKGFCLFLLVAILSLWGCGTEKSVEIESTTAPSFLAGFAIADITPTESVPLRGSGNTSLRMSNGLLDPLYLTCVALTDEDSNTALLFSYDISGCYENITGPMLQKVSEETGVPLELISLSASLFESDPRLSSIILLTWPIVSAPKTIISSIRLRNSGLK